MKPLWKSQPKKFNIHSSRKPTQDYPLSGVVLFRNSKMLGYSYISLDYDTVEAIARKMPYGISHEDPAYVLVIEEDGKYQVYCRYHFRPQGVLLWEQEERPKWLRGISMSTRLTKNSIESADHAAYAVKSCR